jgi:dephospho-CoA kinase
MERNGLSREEARSRLDAQMSNEERARRSARVIANEGSLPDLERAIAELWREETGLPP